MFQLQAFTLGYVPGRETCFLETALKCTSA